MLFDGRPWSQIPRSVKKTSFAKVSQEVFLFRGTVRENLTDVDSTVPESALVQACKDACILDVVQALREGFDAEVLEGGANFSGGQRQRLSSPVRWCTIRASSVLDEATSALDTETERAHQRAAPAPGLTLILVAHLAEHGGATRMRSLCSRTARSSSAATIRSCGTGGGIRESDRARPGPAEELG